MKDNFPKLFPHQPCCYLSPPPFFFFESPVECKWSEEAACCPVTLCGLVTLWLCGVAPTCPLALPINYRWNQVPESTYSKHNMISHTHTQVGLGLVTNTAQTNMLE